MQNLSMQYQNDLSRVLWRNAIRYRNTSAQPMGGNPRGKGDVGTRQNDRT